MALVLSDDGISTILAIARAEWNSVNPNLHLYSNNLTPNTSSTLGSFTECTFPGYAAIALASFGAPSVSSHVATMSETTRTFTRSSTGTAENVYGYFVTDDTDTVLLWSEKDPNGPFVMQNAGDSYSVLVKLTEKDSST